VHRRRPAAAARLAVALSAGLSACAQDQPRVTQNAVVQPGRPGEPATTLPPGTTLPPSQDPYDEADVAFLVAMVPHHEQALQMARLAPDRAADDRVVGLASRIADVQQAEIDVYTRWLADHGLGPDGRPDERAGQDHGGSGDGHDGEGGHDGSMPGMAGADDLAALEAAEGAEFDRLWLTLRVAHHEGALEMVAEREREGVNTRVGELAADVHVTQLDEIATMRAVLEDL
jgi:uncharacterized protein (DUF305 family)